ncbi:YdcF family protein [Ramlibacter terrae]|uniref:YdcF family protein n=1 Tax=Ramlibacter terrae TaxID=2732511 RepID=A0ABX6P1Y4_9BURK|nr:YdcF family protein [Ramlibacter terrae]
MALVEAGGRLGSHQATGRVQAILVLGGRTARVHDAARLHRATGLPILISGKGTGDSGFRAESQKMQDILRKQYGIEASGIETESVNTQENAAFSWCQWGRQGIRHVLLVTDVRHMLRARTAFSLAGFDVVPAPAQQALPENAPLTLQDWRPGRAGFKAATPALMEIGGAAALVMARVLDGAPACAKAGSSAGPATPAAYRSAYPPPTH